MSVVALQDVLLAGARIVIEDEIERLIGVLDRLEEQTGAGFIVSPSEAIGA